jgi:hypothetical protein
MHAFPASVYAFLLCSAPLSSVIARPDTEPCLLSFYSLSSQVAGSSGDLPDPASLLLLAQQIISYFHPRPPVSG